MGFKEEVFFMSILNGIAVPHPPLIVPNVGRGEEKDREYYERNGRGGAEDRGGQAGYGGDHFSTCAKLL